MGAMASQINYTSIVRWTVCSCADQGIYQSSASLAFVREIHRWSLVFPHKGSVTRKMFPFDDVIMNQLVPKDAYRCTLYIVKLATQTAHRPAISAYHTTYYQRGLIFVFSVGRTVLGKDNRCFHTKVTQFPFKYFSISFLNPRSLIPSISER